MNMTDGFCDECGYDLAADLEAEFFTRSDGTMTCVPCAEIEIRFIVEQGYGDIVQWLGAQW